MLLTLFVKETQKYTTAKNRKIHDQYWRGLTGNLVEN